MNIEDRIDTYLISEKRDFDKVKLSTDVKKDMAKVIKTIKSAKNTKQLRVAHNMARNLIKTHGRGFWSEFIDSKFYHGGRDGTLEDLIQVQRDRIEHIKDLKK